MPVTAQMFPGRDVVKLHVSGRFDFGCYPQFSWAAEQARSGNPMYIIDLENADRIHDSGVAMLTMLRNKVGSDAVIELVNCGPSAREFLRGFGWEQYCSRQ